MSPLGGDIPVEPTVIRSLSPAAVPGRPRHGDSFRLCGGGGCHFPWGLVPEKETMESVLGQGSRCLSYATSTVKYNMTFRHAKLDLNIPPAFVDVRSHVAQLLHPDKSDAQLSIMSVLEGSCCITRRLVGRDDCARSGRAFVSSRCE